MSGTWSQALSDATRFELVLHRRNRLALALVVAFIPVWLTLVNVIIPDGPIDFHHAVTGRTISVDGNRLAMISGAMNAVTLIIGFMMFAAVRRSSDFDRRLVLAGYSRSALLLAKLVALLLVDAVVSVYATVVLVLFWAPEQIVPFLLGLTLSGLTYGGIGVVLGVVFRTELAGMFLIIMISLVDVMVQNPIITSSTARPGAIRLLPTYGSMQNAVGAAFTGDLSVGYFLLGLLWLTGTALFGLVAFQRRTRDHIERADAPSMPQAPPERAATVHVTAQADGTLSVTSVSGPIHICTCAAGEQSKQAAIPPAKAPAQRTRRTRRTPAQDVADSASV